ncbi:MAG TPA: dTDP-4-dehydrorhamnose 3,5-epimerase [Terriglobales bacterium]|nr:dTDP-4-dehydrorhamnose 3,5-epimerase [Terriglobales bacterium]
MRATPWWNPAKPPPLSPQLGTIPVLGIPSHLPSHSPIVFSAATANIPALGQVRIVEEFPSGVLVLEPRVYHDDRGYFFESFNQAEFNQFVPKVRFVQDNQSRSRRNVLRGLHYQIRQPQGKLIRVLSGEVFDVGVDLRRNSPWFGMWNGVRLSSDMHRMLWIPPGFAHGFLVLSDFAEIHYKATDYYAAQHERTVLWNDPELGIDWPAVGEPVLSAKDERGERFCDAEVYHWLTPPLTTIAEVLPRPQFKTALPPTLASE